MSLSDHAKGFVLEVVVNSYFSKKKKLFTQLKVNNLRSLQKALKGAGISIVSSLSFSLKKKMVER